MRFVGILLGAILASSLAAIVPTASAVPFDGVTFTEVVTDDADNVGALDILSVALGEPGDGTLVFRMSVSDFSVNNANLGDDFFFTTPDGSYAPGFNGAGEPDGNGNINDYVPDSCTVDVNDVYCVMKYADIGLAVGDSVTQTFAISYAGVAQDYAPGTGGYVPNGVTGPVGDDYVITGCSRADMCSATGGGGISINLAAASASADAKPGSSATYDLTVTNGGAATTYTLSAVGLSPGYTASFDPASGSLTANATATSKLTVEVPANAASGTTVSFSAKVVAGDANKTVALTLNVKAATGTTTTTDSHTGTGTATDITTTLDTGTGTGTTSKTTSAKSPGFEFLANLVAVGLVVVAMRRRLQA